jgi:hypothetical protein
MRRYKKTRDIKKLVKLLQAFHDIFELSSNVLRIQAGWEQVAVPD